MKKRVKVFETGKYPQGEYDFQRVKKIFGDIKDKIKAQLAHTSKAKGKEIILGEFDNFKVTEEGKVYADLEFNTKGLNYYEDGALEGLSVEVPNDTLTKIACLPLGVKPQIEGAEFEQGEGYFVFGLEVLPNNTTEFSSVIEWINTNRPSKEQVSQIFKSLKDHFTSEEDLNSLVSEFEKIKIKPEEEKMRIRAEIKAEFEERDRERTSVKRAKEFMEKNKLKISPAMKEVLNENLMKEFFKRENYEFEDKKVSAGEIIERIFDKIPDFIKLGEVVTEEFEETRNNNPVDTAKAQWGLS